MNCLRREHIFCEVVRFKSKCNFLLYSFCLFLVVSFLLTPLRVAGKQHTKTCAAELEKQPGQVRHREVYLGLIGTSSGK